MMMHHDGQPLWTRRALRPAQPGRFLRRAGAVDLQVTILTPSVGSKGYEQPFATALVLEPGRRPAGRGLPLRRQPLHRHQRRPSVAQAAQHARQLRRFYNPLNLLLALPRFDKVWADRVVFQLLGMVGLAKSIYQCAAGCGGCGRADRTLRSDAAPQVPDGGSRQRERGACRTVPRSSFRCCIVTSLAE